MAVYTVHQPPLVDGENAPDPSRFTFVRDGFYLWGFVLSLLWMLRHRLWIVALLFTGLSVLIDIGLRYAGVGAGFRFFILVAFAFLVGLEGATLRRWTLKRRGYTNVGVVVADNQDDAERRFFVNWQAGLRPHAAPPPANADSVARKGESGRTDIGRSDMGRTDIGRSEPTDVIGSSPQPERRV